MYLVGSVVLVSLAGCGRGFFQGAEREPWRREAEVACLKSGAVKESAELVRIEPISGPGMCGAEFPLKVAALGESSAIGFANDLRPPAALTRQPRWPIADRAPRSLDAQASTLERGPASGNAPVPLNAPGSAQVPDDIDLPPEGHADVPAANLRYPSDAREPDRIPTTAYPSAPLPRLGPASGNHVAAIGPVAVKPGATLACPIVSALDRWIVEAMQPAAMRWFGSPVVEIKQISAYSCRGMNGNPNARISEHAFGNALDIAGFTLADGRRISVKDGWRGLPEEQGFLRDVHAAACDRFTTVLSPGSNIYHYNHIHVDLMRRSSRRVICKPAAVSGDQIAARASGGSYAARDAGVTGSLGRRAPAAKLNYDAEDAEDE